MNVNIPDFGKDFCTKCHREFPLSQKQAWVKENVDTYIPICPQCWSETKQQENESRKFEEIGRGITQLITEFNNEFLFCYSSRSASQCFLKQGETIVSLIKCSDEDSLSNEVNSLIQSIKLLENPVKIITKNKTLVKTLQGEKISDFNRRITILNVINKYEKLHETSLKFAEILFVNTSKL